MPFILAFLRAAFFYLAEMLPVLVVKIIYYAGFSVVTYSLSSYGIDYIFSHLKEMFTGLPSFTLEVLSYCNVDDVIGMILGAYTAKAVLNGVCLQSNKVKKIQFRNVC